MNKNNGFTLIELLGVIILLGIIGLIVYPIINNSIKISKEKVYKEIVQNIENAALQYSVEQELEEDNNYNSLTLLDLKSVGLLSDKDIINPINNELMMGCVIYRWDEKNNQFEFKYDERCIVPDIKVKIQFEVVGNPINSNGWANQDFYVKIKVENALSYKWCGTTGEICTPTSLSKEDTNVFIHSESSNYHICVLATNILEESQFVVCSESYKLDKTLPSIEGVNDITIQKNDSIHLSNGVTYSDTLSGIEGSISITPSTVDTSKAGTTNVTYKVSDLAGNERSIVRKVIVDADGPLITYEVQGNPMNSNGWAKNDFYVKGVITDQSGLGIRSAKWCSSTSGTCTPIAELNGTELNSFISSESNNNRICLHATDNNNKTSEVMCSDTYKLDKTAPIISGVIDTSVTQESDIDLALGVSFVDGLSGIESFTITPNEIDTFYPGFIDVQYYAIDQADNETFLTRTIEIIEREAPKHLLIINYVDAYGEKVSESVIMEISEYENFSIISPTVNGYVPNYAVVSGIMEEEDLEVNVIYAQFINLSYDDLEYRLNFSNILEPPISGVITLGSVEVDSTYDEITKITQFEALGGTLTFNIKFNQYNTFNHVRFIPVYDELNSYNTNKIDWKIINTSNNINQFNYWFTVEKGITQTQSIQLTIPKNTTDDCQIYVYKFKVDAIQGENVAVEDLNNGTINPEIEQYQNLKLKYIKTDLQFMYFTDLVEHSIYIYVPPYTDVTACDITI